MESLAISRSRILSLMLLTLAVYVISYREIGLVITYLIFFFGLILIFFNFRMAVSYYLLFILAYDDINKYDNDLPPFNTVFTVSVAGISLSMIWTIILFICLLVYFTSKNLSSWRIPHPMVVMIFFFLLGSMTIFQYKNDYFISDVGFVVNIILGFLVGQALLQSEERIRYYFATIITVFFSKYAIMTLDSIAQSIAGTFYGFKGESAANYLVVPLILVLLLLFYKRLKINPQTRFYFSVALLFLVAYLFITISRERILLAALSLLAFLIIYKKTRILFYFGILTIIAILVIARYNPNMYNFVSWKLTTYMPSSSGKTNPSSTVRLIELKNIWKEQLESPYKLFIGTGWGGYFTSRNFGFTKEILGTRSYPPESIERDTFFRPHGTYLYVLLKYGLLGLLLFYGSLIIFSIQNIYDRTVYKMNKTDDRVWMLRYIQVALSIAVPLTCLVIFTSKLQILTGFFIAMIFYSRKEIATILRTDLDK